MTAFRVLLGCALVIGGIWGFAGIVRYLSGHRAEPETARRSQRTWILLFQSVVPFIAGIVLIANASGTAAANWVFNLTAAVLLAWMAVEEAGAWFRSRRERGASAPPRQLD